MTVCITGDTHGRTSIAKLFSCNFDERGLTKDDYLVICGDFGLIWNEASLGAFNARAYEKTLDWLDSKPFTTLFVDGNHEDYDLLDAYPVEQWHGGKVHKIRDSVIHLMRGQIFDIDGKLFLTMGGARSIDKEARIEGLTWWEDEIPSESDWRELERNLDERGWAVDYVLTHDCPRNVVYDMALRANADFTSDAFEQRLQALADRLVFEKWFFGHYHEDLKDLGVGGKYVATMNLVYDLDEKDWSDRINPRSIYGVECLPAPSDERGYTFDEIAEIAQVSLERVDEAMRYELMCATATSDENGNTLIYAHDVTRILFWC